RTPGRGVVIEGPSGIGKTTAVRRAAADIGLGDRAQILSGRNPQDREIIASLPSMAGLGVVVVDDFHRLDDSVKHAMADFLQRIPVKLTRSRRGGSSCRILHEKVSVRKHRRVGIEYEWSARKTFADRL